MDPSTEQELLDQAYVLLNDLLSGDKEMTLTRAPDGAPDTGHDEVWEIRAPNYAAPVLVEAYRRFTPRHVDRVLGGISKTALTLMRHPAVVVVAPWLSPRAREVLTERGLNYLDLTGNVRIRVSRPAVYLRLDGAAHDPNPPPKPPVRLKGTQIHSLVRVMVDVAPPYRMVELARAAGLSYGYVSRALEALHDERLIERPPSSKTVTDVDWQGLLRARAEHYDFLKSNESKGFVARAGAADLYNQLAAKDDQAAVVTGSFAVADLVRVAAPTQLALYVPNIADFAQLHDLMPTARGANVVLLKAADKSQLVRARAMPTGGFRVGESQLALDCLRGNGRLPEEGEAVLGWMADNVGVWRRPSLSEEHYADSP